MIQDLHHESLSLWVEAKFIICWIYTRILRVSLSALNPRRLGKQRSRVYAARTESTETQDTVPCKKRISFELYCAWNLYFIILFFLSTSVKDTEPSLSTLRMNHFYEGLYQNSARSFPWNAWSSMYLYIEPDTWLPPSCTMRDNGRYIF